MDAHAKGIGQPRDLLADGAEPDDAEGLVAQLVELCPRQVVAAPAAGGDALMLPDQQQATAIIRRIACSDTAVELAPPLLQTGMPAPRAASMSTVS